MRMIFALLFLFGLMASPAAAQPMSECLDDIPASVTLRARVTCQLVEAPLDPENADAGTHWLWVVTLSAAERPLPDPIMFLSGGPGVGLDAYWPAVESMIDGGLLEATQRDLILFDQRGVGNSHPSLSCAREEEVAQTVPLNINRVCSVRLDTQLDLTVYTTIHNAADVEAVRAALGYEHLNLFGHSYGSRLALAVMRYQPETARTVLLEGTFPPNARFLALPRYVDGALARVFDACDQNSECAAAYGDLETLFSETYAQLKAAPHVGGFNHQTLVRSIYYLMEASRADQPSVIPAFIRAARDGDFAAMQTAWAIIDMEIPPSEAVSEGMQTLINCADEAPFLTEAFLAEANAGVRPEVAEVFTGSVRGQFLEQCRNWPRVELDPSHYEGVVSDIPTLILNGTFDQVTALENAQLAADSLENATLVPFPGWGHWPIGRGNPCAIAIYADFLTEPSSAVDSSCVAATPITFVIP